MKAESSDVARRANLRGLCGSARDKVVDSPLLTVSEAAEYLRVSQRTVYELMRAGKLARTRVAGCVRVHIDDLDLLLGAGRSVVAKTAGGERYERHPGDLPAGAHQASEAERLRRLGHRLGQELLERLNANRIPQVDVLE